MLTLATYNNFRRGWAFFGVGGVGGGRIGKTIEHLLTFNKYK